MLYPLADDQFNVVRLLSDAGTQEQYLYDPYGRFRIDDANGNELLASAYDWDILYGGYRYDPETGLYHVRRRMYSPELGRWLQQDPKGYVDGPNLYEYARGNPVTFVDPSGEAILGGLGIAAVAIYVGQALFRGALWSSVETPIEAGVATALDDESFTWGGAWLRNFAVNSALGLIPGGTEAKVAIKSARIGAKLFGRGALRASGHLGVFGSRVTAGTAADAVWLAAVEGRSTTAALGEALIGNVGGEIIGAGLKRAARIVDRAVARGVVWTDAQRLTRSSVAYRFAGGAGRRYLQMRQLEIAYRGQHAPLPQGEEFLSPLAREGGGRLASINYIRRYASHMSDEDIAGFSARWKDNPLPPAAGAIGGIRVGGAGIPFSSRLRTALNPNFSGGPQGVAYAVLVPHGLLLRPRGWPSLEYERELTALHSLSREYIIGVFNLR